MAATNPTNDPLQESDLLAQLRVMNFRDKRQDQTLSERDLLAYVVNHTQDLVFWKDRNGVYQGCNVGFARTIGLENPTEIIGKTDEELLRQKEMAEAFAEMEQDVIENDLPYASYEFVKCADGEAERWIRTYRLPIKNSSGKISGILGIVRDEEEESAAPIRARIGF
ncbi:MAG: PAS domain-containing protein [Sphingobacteriia bacterium]